MQPNSLTEIVEEVTKSLSRLKESELGESPTVSDYADALPAVLFYVGITGKADSSSSFSELIGMDPSHVSRAINRKLPEQAPIKGRQRETPYVSIYKSAMRGLELPVDIDPRIWSRSYQILAESMIKVIHGTARAITHEEYVRIMERYANTQVPGIRTSSFIGRIQRGSEKS